MSIEKFGILSIFFKICVKCYKNNPQQLKNIDNLTIKKLLTYPSEYGII